MVKSYGILGRETKIDETRWVKPATYHDSRESSRGEPVQSPLTLVDDKVLVPPAFLGVGGAAPSLADHAGDARALEVRGLG